MKALLQKGYGGRENLSIVDLPKPIPGPGQIRVQVEACGANASDWEFTTGRPAYARIAGMLRPRPRILGSDIVGIVDAVGESVVLETGQRVVADTFMTFGGFAEYCVAKADRFVPVPEGIDPTAAACLPQSGAIILEGLSGRITQGTRVLINGGGGGCGPLAIQYAVSQGAKVTGIDNAMKQTVMRDAGAAEVYDYRQTDFTPLGKTWDVILDLFGTRRARTIPPVLAEGGRYMMVGGSVPTLLNILITGPMNGKGGRKIGMLSVEQGPKHLPELLGLLADGTLKPVIGETVSPDQAIDALARMGAGEIAGKLVIRP